jgi:hypothetical protein
MRLLDQCSETLSGALPHMAELQAEEAPEA